MMKKKLLFINGHLNTGGVEKALLDVLKHLDYSRYEVDLLLLEELGDYAPELPEQVNVRLMSLKNTYGSVGQALLRCVRQGDWFCLRMRLILLLAKVFGLGQLRLAKQMLTGGKHYDCVIGFRRGICTQIAAFAVNADRRITWWHHGSVNVDESYLREVAPCQHIVAVSNACKDMLTETFPQLEEKLVVVPNMLDMQVVQQKAEQFDPYPDKSLLHIVSVGGLVPEKHFEDSIYAAQRLKKGGISFQWHLVGDGVLCDRLKKQAEEKQVDDCFLFEGNQVNPYPYMRHADLFVHPSYVESFGIVILEALALGVPSVVSKSAGAWELLGDGRTGLLVEKDPDALSEEVLRVLADPILYQKLKDNAHCPEQFLPERVMERVEGIFETSL